MAIWVSAANSSKLHTCRNVGYFLQGRVVLRGSRVLLGVSGGIAAYKAAELTRRLREAGAEVRVVMTANAARFVTPLTLQALSGHPIRTTLWDDAAEAAMSHIELARWAEHIVIAPASANVIAQLAHGFANNLLTAVCLASAAPLFIAPAMNQQMWRNPATQANVEQLLKRGVSVIGPAEGDQACGDFGPGRLVEVSEIVEALSVTRGPRLLENIPILITAGPTYEDIDPVRFIGNRSSGRMGFAITQAAVEQGACVTLIAGPVALETPIGVTRIDVRSAQEMRSAVLAEITNCQIFISVAAVADYRPVSVLPHKLKKTASKLVLELEQNPDILAEVSQLPKRPFLVGFAAETEAAEEYARGKLKAKQLDMIVANQVGGGLGFETEDNALSVLWAERSERLPRASKRLLASQLISYVAERFKLVHGQSQHFQREEGKP